MSIYTALWRLPRKVFLSMLLVAVVVLFLTVQFKPLSSKPKLGVTYVMDSAPSDVREDLDNIHRVGFSLVRTYYIPTSDRRFSTHLFLLSYAQQLGMEVYIVFTRYYDSGALGAYVRECGEYIDYYQILNEVDIWMRSGSLFYMTSEVTTYLRSMATVIKLYDKDCQTLTTFTPVCVFRQTILEQLVSEASAEVDFVGLDVYETFSRETFTGWYQYLKTLTKKTVWIAEFGSAKMIGREQEQASDLLTFLETFEKHDVPVAIVFRWDSDDWGICGVQAERTLQDYINGGA